MKRFVLGLSIVASVASLLLAACSGDGESPVVTPTMPVATPTPSLAPELDSSTTLPGTYVPPHPGADGKLDTDDDVDHFANGTVMPFCTPAQIAANT